MMGPNIAAMAQVSTRAIQAGWDALAANPRLVVAVAGGALALVAALALYRRLRRAPGERFRALLAGRESISVLLHPNPDGDAMAAGIAVAELAESVDTDAVIQYTGQVRRQENRAFRTVLDVELDRIDHVSDLAAEAVVLVDHNTPRGFAGADGVLPFAVLDHHPGEGGGEGADSKRHAAPLDTGTEDVLHGMMTRVIDDDVEVHSVSAGLDYPGVGPEHAMFREVGRCEYRGITDDEALDAFRELSESEGIIPALETSHGLALAKQLAEEGEHDSILVNLSGRGDKDMETAAAHFDM